MELYRMLSVILSTFRIFAQLMAEPVPSTKQCTEDWRNRRANPEYGVPVCDSKGDYALSQYTSGSPNAYCTDKKGNVVKKFDITSALRRKPAREKYCADLQGIPYETPKEDTLFGFPVSFI
ncbi:hypothetical protein RvY_11238 [Ramazzottius varieornatus]|uniref:Thyroglobulin type-1 domain-containing protein n=1 Tax=Ramazzottius varieornatus TaxID=947166 RepID=A0A1D1VFH2_RAMVA|nr:hypothetical protein RvY_11238 [Ramazzottius varieornatus]